MPILEFPFEGRARVDTVSVKCLKCNRIGGSPVIELWVTWWFSPGFLRIYGLNPDGDEEACGMGEDDSFGVLNAGFGPVLAAFAAGDFALDADVRVGGNWAEVFDLHLAGHGGHSLGAVGFAHGFVEQSCDDAAVEVAGRALVVVGDSGVGDDGALW